MVHGGGAERTQGFLRPDDRSCGMATWIEDPFVRRSVLITLLWLLAMLVGGFALVRFGDVIQGLFA